MGKYFEDSVTDMKHFADKKKRDLSSMRAHNCSKDQSDSAPRYFGPSKILEHIGPVSYKLKFQEM
jgi:hypothetical protein